MTFETDPINIMICGVGGQGNILLSRMIGKILAGKGYRVTIGETFGAAQRGGSVYSSLRVSKKRTYGPLVPEGKAHFIAGLEPLETLRMLCMFGNAEVSTVTNLFPVYPVGVLAKRLRYPDADELKSTIQKLSRNSWFLNSTAIAGELGSPIVSNIVMLGAITATRSLPFQVEEVEQEMKNTFPASALDLNRRAFRKGLAAAG
ncbi:MAG: indolepyruvate oxidoreductase subunit beta [Deltaproteobacteria bacterium]|nr:indolepyruvate oxidoreductase subunit beta [Deltaproteobacteria bacterium]